MRHRLSLDNWLEDCRRRMATRYPKINFDADHWAIRTLYQTTQADWHFTSQIIDFTGKDRSFCDVMRCLVAEMIISGKPKSLMKPISAFRRLAATQCNSIFDLTLGDIRALEEDGLREAKMHPLTSNRIYEQHTKISQQLLSVADKNVIPHLGYFVRADIRHEFLVLSRSNKKEKSTDLLDRKIEALNDAVNALVDNDPRLDAMDRVAICTMLRKLCAPSRINEVLCSSIDDFVTVDDYAKKSKSTTTEDVLHDAHKMLLVTMKGSKGAQWSAKPVLNFMIDAFIYTNDEIKRSGCRSRMLIEWYQTHPDKLYLPSTLEHLRGKPLSRSNLASIIYLSPTTRNGAEASVGTIFNTLKNLRFRGPNPQIITLVGTKNPRSVIDFLPWVETEEFLLKKVLSAMEACRRVTHENYYEGDLSKMLFLFDRSELPYLPYALNAKFIRERLKKPLPRKNNQPIPAPTLFEKLNITIPKDGRIQIAEMDTHDPRRWVTTMALRHGERLSDVLINKWANRLSLSQLKSYDFRSQEELATFSKMPDISDLKDLSNGLAQAQKLEETYGIKTDIVVVHDAGISVTSLQRVLDAVDDRPIAKTSEQIIIVYPSIYGVCLHQHHTTPCRRYGRCLTCNENVCVKGHLPTNHAIREDETLLASMIVRQVEALVVAHNRGVADCQDALAAHIAALIERGLCPHQMADHLINDFNEIKDQIKDKLLRKRLEEAFVARSYVKLLDNDNVAIGALMKYHNPKQHASPGLEMALDSRGGREQVCNEERVLVEKFPIFAQTSLGLQDERYLIEADDDDDDDDDGDDGE